MAHDELREMRELTEMTRLSKSTIYKLIADGAFPAPVKVGRRSMWKYSEILNWIDSLENEAAA